MSNIMKMCSLLESCQFKLNELISMQHYLNFQMEHTFIKKWYHCCV
jgi:hypothetical protein